MLGLGSNLVLGGVLGEPPRFSLLFDGTGDYAEVDVAEINGLTNFSVSFWFKYPSDSDLTTNQVMISGGATSANRFYIQLLTATSIRVGSNVGYNTLTGLTSMAADTWHHCVHTLANTVGNVYVNGVDETGNLTVKPPAANLGDNFRIGRSYGGYTNYFDGKITDVAVFDAALSSGTVTNMYNSGKPTNLVGASDLQGYWRMTTVNDSSDNGNNLTLSGDAVITEDAP